MGRNYAAHAKELNNIGADGDMPLLFMKPNTAVIGPDDPIVLPHYSEDVQVEAELAIVIGRLTKDVSPEGALAAIYGYTCANDVTARDTQRAENQWFRAKTFDTSLPLGPWIETDLDTSDLEVASRINGKPAQAGNTRDMIWDAAQIVSMASEVVTLLPGDVVLTGTPSGVSTLRHGDRVDVDIEGIGVLSNPVIRAMSHKVRVRFCPSPTGTPHVGLIRTALFNWAYARHTGGDFVFRIEDTDAERDSQESYDQLLDALRWLGLDWDEGPEVGGEYGPYRQSERREIYADVAARLLEGGFAYESFSTPEEVEARHLAAGRDPKLGYDGYDRDLTDDQKAAYRAEGRDPVIRLRMPDEDITFTDLIRGEVTFRAGSVPDFVIVRGNGQPLYTLVNPVDDALMKITHVLRGEDLLSSTPRQIALYQALMAVGLADAVPTFAHLPMVTGEGNKKLSKRAPESNLFLHRERGFLPEGLLNYLGLLGWSISADRDIFTLNEMITAFDVADVNPNPARFDLKKAEAINAEHMRLLPRGEFVVRLVPYLHAAGVIGAAHVRDLTPHEEATLALAAPLVQERMTLLSEAPGMLGFFFTGDDTLVIEDDARASLPANAAEIVDAAIGVIEGLEHFGAEEQQEALRAALVDGMGIKPRDAFGPLRVGITGRRVSPPLFESMEILGQDHALARLRALRATL